MFNKIKVTVLRWVIGDLDTHQPFCQELCRRSGSTVVSVDYRLAPEHPFPAAHNDCLFSATWIANRLGDLGPNNGTVKWARQFKSVVSDIPGILEVYRMGGEQDYLI